MSVCKEGRSARRIETIHFGKCLKGNHIGIDAAEVRGLP
jgi:hypothetical protein